MKITLKHLKRAVFVCSCKKTFPCLLSLSAHNVAAHKRNILACSNPKHKHRSRKQTAKLRFSLRGSPHETTAL